MLVLIYVQTREKTDISFADDKTQTKSTKNAVTRETFCPLLYSRFYNCERGKIAPRPFYRGCTLSSHWRMKTLQIRAHRIHSSILYTTFIFLTIIQTYNNNITITFIHGSIENNYFNQIRNTEKITRQNARGSYSCSLEPDKQ